MAYQRLSLSQRHTQLCDIICMSRDNWWRPVHDFIRRALVSYYEPHNWHLLALEMPAVPEDGDRTRVAYWQSEKKQAKNLRTVTSLGKYLRRHFPDMPDHAIRDMVALAAPASFEIWTGADSMVRAVQEGPQSCMKWEDYDKHPYEVYTEDYGWAVAVRLQGSTILGRCVIHTKKKVYVRSYGRDEHEGRSQDDNALEAWLNDQGYENHDYWPEGVKFAKIEFKRGYLMPYLDGASYDDRRVRISETCIIRDGDGGYVCDNTDGTMTHDERCTCDECGDAVDSDDTTYVDATDQHVCQHCLEYRFTYVRGTRESNQGRVSSYYVSNRDAVSVGGQGYDSENLPSSIVTLHDGEYCEDDDAVWVESENEYYSIDDCSNRKNSDRLVVLLENGDYALRENSAYCECNDEWYDKDDCREFLDGTYCLEDDVDSYLEGLTEGQLREKLEEEEAEKVMASDGWVYSTNQAQSEQVPLPLPPAEAVATHATATYPVTADKVRIHDLDLSAIEARILAWQLASVPLDSIGRIGAAFTNGIGIQASELVGSPPSPLRSFFTNYAWTVPIQPNARIVLMDSITDKPSES